MNNLSSVYLKNNSSVSSSYKRLKFIKVAISSSLALFIILLSVFAASLSSIKPAHADGDSFDPVRYVFCLWSKDSVPHEMYQISQTSDLQFALRSKSSISPGRDGVDSFMNKVLEFSGNNFTKNNENILGYKLNDLSTTSSTPDPKKFNKGPKINPYDRFGVAGLTWSAYAGEWKYVVVDACNPTNAVDPKTGLYYSGRLVPQSTWSDINNSQDIRTRQFNSNLVPALGVSFLNTASNYIFDISKILVVFTIALINFAFSDIVKTLGLDSMIAGSGGSTGIFGLLFKGVYTPLIFIMFGFTAVYILYVGVVKRELRKSLNVVVRSIALFFIAIIVAAKPLMWVSLPNNVSVVIQSVIVETMNTSLAGGNGLCATDIGSTSTNITKGSDGSPSSILENASKNLSSSIGCSMWQQFLLKPWSQGQFGTDWNDTWAKGKIAPWAKDSPKAFNNSALNAKMVGNAAVPMGGGSYIDNWALFQISTQTDVHSPIGANGTPSKYTAGLANDWWRIADVTSNYTEKQVSKTVPGASIGDPSSVGTFTVPDTSKEPLPVWDSWSGNSIFGRFITSVSSVLVALIGVAAPLYFSIMSAIYSIGIALIMSFAPIMLLLGCWANKGWEIFKSWGELLVKVFVKRIITGTLLVISLIFSSTAIKIMESSGWWQGMLLMLLLSIILISSRKKIVDMVSSIKFATLDFSQKTAKVTEVFSQSGKVVTGAAVGGVAQRRAGGTFASGSLSGAKNELKNLSYQNSKLAPIRQTYQQLSKTANDDVSNGTCYRCGDPLNSSPIVFADSSGGFLCQNCGEASTDTGLREIFINDEESKSSSVITTDPIKTVIPNLSSNVSSIRDDSDIDIDEKEKELVDMASNTNREIENVKSEKLHSVQQEFPAPPQEIQEFLDIDSVNQAWLAGNYDYIRMAYTVGWASWFVREIGDEFVEDVDEFVDRLYRSVVENQ